MPLTDTILWADGFILVYSITERGSFNYIRLVKQYIQDVRASIAQTSASNNNHNGNMVSASGAPAAAPLVLLGNKADMVHLRQVATEEGAASNLCRFLANVYVPSFLSPGEILSKDFDCYFAEVAAADQVSEVAEAFHELCREVTLTRRKNKTSLLNRVLGNKSGGLRAYTRGKSDSVLSKD